MLAQPANWRWEDHMARFCAVRITATAPKTAPSVAALATIILATAAPGLAADVTPNRLVNADKEPQNWLMNHRTYDGQRFSPLARINKNNVRNLKLVYAIPLGGSSGDEWIEATPLAENGSLYITDAWGVLYKIDATSGEVGRIVWRMEPKQEKQSNIAARRCGAIWSFRPPIGLRGLWPPTKTPAKSCGKRM
jgi:glucose dehydrogenase